MNCFHNTLAFLAVLCFGQANIIFAEEMQQVETAALSNTLQDIAYRDYLLGDWGGNRTRLAKDGLNFEFMYYGIVPAVVSGGIKRGALYQGALASIVDMDLKKLADLKSGHLHISTLWLHGNKPFSDDYIGDLNKVSLIDFPNAFKLWELWYEHRWFEDRLSAKTGVMAIDQDFLVPQYSNLFVNQTFWFPTLAFNVWDVEGFAEGNHALASTPYGALGARIRLQPNDHWYVQLGVYDGNPDTSSAFNDLGISDEEGTLSYFETGVSYSVGSTSQPLKGNLKLGGFYHTDEFLDVTDAVYAAAGLPTNNSYHSGNYGVYLQAEQALFREHAEEDAADEGLSGFLRLATAPPDRNLTEFEIDGGIVYKGLFSGREWDTAGLAFSYLKMSGDIEKSQENINRLSPGSIVPVDYEGLVELTYRFQITPWLTMQPSLQWVIHPEGSEEKEDALAALLMTTVRF